MSHSGIGATYEEAVEKGFKLYLSGGCDLHPDSVWITKHKRCRQCQRIYNNLAQKWSRARRSEADRIRYEAYAENWRRDNLEKISVYQKRYITRVRAAKLAEKARVNEERVAAGLRPIHTRKEAKALGMKQYYTGKPCKQGHDAMRYVCNRQCIPCQSDSMKRYHARRKNS